MTEELLELQNEGYKLHIEAGPFCFYPADPKRKVRTKDKIAYLSMREFKFLIHLAIEPRAVITHQELAEVMDWNKDGILQFQARELAFRLRKKVDTKTAAGWTYIKNDLTGARGYYLDPRGCTTPT